MYFDTDISKKERKRLVLTGFRGVDAASPMYKIDNQRAAAMRNFISINGYNHKRPGWKQIGRIKDSNGNSLGINGYFKFTIAHQDIRIVYAGTTFFLYKDGAYCDMSLPATITNNIETNLLQNCPAQMFIDNDRAYFLGMGDFLVLGVFEGVLKFKRVYNDDMTFIPTTTVNIAPKETDYHPDGTVVTYGERQTINDVNILQSRRMNNLIGSKYWKNKSTANTEYADADLASNFDAITKTYQLDGKHLQQLFSATASHYDETAGETKEYKLVATVRVEGETCERNILGEDATGNGVNIKSKTLRFDTSVKSMRKIGTYSTTDLRFNIIKAGAFIVYAVNEVANDTTNNTLTLYYTLDNCSTKTKAATAQRLNANEKYAIAWEGSIVSTPTVVISTATDANVSFRDDTSNYLGLNITCTELPARKWYIRDANATVADKTSGDDGFGIANFVPGGRTTWGTIDYETGVITLYVNPRPIEGESNIFVTFKDEDKDYSERITNCGFGTLFGAKGNANTLFVSGNEDYHNYDYWSKAEDFTYFPSNNLCCVGTSNTAIKGYQRLGDETLAIFKEDKGNEPTLYIRTGTTNTEEILGYTISTAYFVTAGKYITQGAISRRAIGMLNGDAIFLSRRGVYGVQISSDSIAVENRVARERSRLINPLLNTHTDLSKAVSIIHDNKFYLALDNYVYIADARYVFTQKGDMTDTYNYEWWMWDDCPVRAWFEMDGELCFGTDDGRICKFDKEFTDRIYEELPSAAFGDTLEDGVIRVTFAEPTGGLDDGNYVYFKGASIHRQLFAAADMSSVENDLYKIKVSEDNLKKIGTGTAVYADGSDLEGLSVNTKYYVSNIDAANSTFELTDADGNKIVVGSSFRLLIDLNGAILKIKMGASGTDFTVRSRYAKDTDADYVLATYNGGSFSATAYKYIEKNVVAEWVTPSLDMGANDYIKTLTRFSLATEQVTDGAVTFGYETKNATGLKEIDSRGLDVMNFDNLNFGKFTFNTGFDSAFTRSIKSDFNFVVFRFKSDNQHDCCVHSLTVEYKVNRRNKGVF